MKYRVKIGYKHFLFDDVIEATTFATTAKEHCMDDDDVAVCFEKDTDNEDEKKLEEF